VRRSWAVGGGLAILGLLVLASRSKATLAPPGNVVWASEADLDALANMLIAETSFARNKNEMAQIVFVALNRSRDYGKAVQDIVSPAQRSPTWNSGADYKRLFESARTNPRWNAARGFSENVLAGAYQNLGATAFVHPAAMSTPPCSSNRVATSTFAGTRCLPSWAVGGRVVGGAMFA